MTHTKILLSLLLLIAWPLGPSVADPVHAIAMHGTPKHGPNFTHFP